MTWKHMEQVFTHPSFSLHVKKKSNGTSLVYFMIYCKIEENALQMASDEFDKLLKKMENPFVFQVVHPPQVHDDIPPPDVSTFMWILKFLTKNSSIIENNLRGICIRTPKLDDIARAACTTFNLLNPHRAEWGVEITDNEETAHSIVRSMFGRVSDNETAHPSD